VLVYTSGTRVETSVGHESEHVHVGGVNGRAQR
jgi:hypothetical protein